MLYFQKYVNEIKSTNDHWITVFDLNEENAKEEFIIHSVLAPKDFEITLGRQWCIDLTFPQLAYTGEGYEYRPFPKENDLEPLVIHRTSDSGNKHKQETNLIQEFIFYFNLFPKEKEKTLELYNSEDDSYEDVVKFENKKIKILSKYLRQFLTLKNKILLTHFYAQEWNSNRLDVLKEEETSDSFCYEIEERFIGDDLPSSDSKKYIIQLHGSKKLEGFDSLDFLDNRKKYLDFLVGKTSDGQEILENCEASYEKNFLKRVFFRAEVLDKYKNNEDYEINDGYITKKGCWGIRADNDNPDYVMVFLGDLGKSLPYPEQMHWKSHEIWSPEHRISNTNFLRSFEGEFADTTRPDFLFKQNFTQFKKTWRNKYNFDLFLIHEKDNHYFNSLTILLDNAQENQIDKMFLGLAKTLIESINAKELKKLCISTKNEDGKELKPLKLLEQFFIENNLSEEFAYTISLLHKIKDRKDTGISHSKGMNYIRANANIRKYLDLNENDGYKELTNKVFETLSNFFQNFENHLKLNSRPTGLALAQDNK